MTLSKKQREQLRALCGELGDDDGVSPADARRLAGMKDEQKHKHAIKQMRLCEQVRRTICVALMDCPDSALTDLEVVGVEPGASMTQLTVVVARGDSTSSLSTREIIRRLQQVEGWLRGQIAPAISRKRVPRLSFACCETPGDGKKVNDGRG